MARNIANRVAQELGQSILIENVGEAGGTIGATKAARATPDGYTFLVGHIGYMAAAPSLYSRLAYDPVKDFQAVFRFLSARVVAFADLGMEAIHEFEVRDMPVTVAVDARGRAIHVLRPVQARQGRQAGP